MSKYTSIIDAFNDGCKGIQSTREVKVVVPDMELLFDTLLDDIEENGYSPEITHKIEELKTIVLFCKDLGFWGSLWVE